MPPRSHPLSPPRHLLPPPSTASTSLRGLATKVEIVEIDLTEEDTSSLAHDSPSSTSIEVVGIRRLEEAIHGVMVRVHANVARVAVWVILSVSTSPVTLGTSPAADG
jgi:hypothetical protein